MERPDAASVAQLIRDADVVVLRSGVALDRETIAAAPRLRLVIRAGTGLDNIDQAALTEKGISLATIPVSAESVAEHALALIFALYRNIPWLHDSLREGRWEKHHSYGRELYGKTIGLVGFGRIGQQTARLAHAFGMQILAHDRSPWKPAKSQLAGQLGVRLVGLDELFRESDIITIHLPLNADTQGLVSASLLGKMRPTAVLVNVGRGRVVDEEALCDVLRRKAILGAALDVFASEPPGRSPLLALDNFIGTPHVGAQTVEAQRRVGEEVVRMIDGLARQNDARGSPPPA